MGFWNSITKIGRKSWNAGKGMVSSVYKPVKQVVSTIHKGANFVDSLLDKAVDIGVPASMVDLIRDNPIYSTIKGTIDTVDDLVEKDLPKFGNVVNDFVEHNLLSKTAPQNLGDLRRIAQEGRDVLSQGQGLVNRAATGFSAIRNPTSRSVMNPSAV